MKLFLNRIRDTLTDSFWFLPGLMALLAAFAALGTVALDHAIGNSYVKNIGWIWLGGPDGARSVLSVIAGSVMTVVSIVYSLTISVLAQTSSHYGPRMLRNFTSDRGVQFTLGTFIATFVYCLLVLRTVRSVQEEEFVPYLSVNLGVVLALASLVVLIFFIHHISQSIQAENLIATVGREFQRVLPTLFPKSTGENCKPEHSVGLEHWENAKKVSSTENGYLQRVDEERLLLLATQYDLQIKLEKRPGDFVARHAPVFLVLPSASVMDETESSLRACLSLGMHRTPYQDPLYSLLQMVEIAAHALSPSTNEPFTALVCIDWLGTSLRGISGYQLSSREHYDANGQLRVVVRPVTFDEMANTAFDQLRIYGANNPEVMTGLLNMIADLAPCFQLKADRDVLMRHAQLIGESSAQITNKIDREKVIGIQQRTISALAPAG
jgi:uncharacterized membrane protein